MRTYLYIAVFSLLMLFPSCREEQLLETGGELFNKTYNSIGNIEAVDFIKKSNGEGFLVLANWRNNANTESCLYLINIDNKGYQLNTIKIKTNYFDEAVAIKPYESGAAILGKRRDIQNNSDIIKSIFLKTDSDGVPFKNSNENDSSIASIITLPAVEGVSFQMNDFLIKEEHIVFGGTVSQTADLSGEIIQIFKKEDLNFTNLSLQPSYQYQWPIDLSFNNKSIQYIVNDDYSNSKGYITIGQDVSLRKDSDGGIGSENVVQKYYRNIDSPVALEPKFGGSRNEVLGAFCKSEFSDALFFAGAYADNDSVVFLSKTNFINRSDSELDTLYEVRETVSGFGNEAVGLVELESGDVILATLKDDINGESSFLTKFSPAGKIIDNKKLEFGSSRSFAINKMITENNSVIILSSVEYANDAQSVGLMKIDF